MNTNTLSRWIGAIAGIVLFNTSVFGAVVTRDRSGTNSILHSGFLTEPGATFARAQVQGGSPDGGGTVVYESDGGTSDPQIRLINGFEGAGGSTYPLASFPNMRTRYRRTGAAGDVHAWRWAPVGGQNIVLAENNGVMAETQGTIPNPSLTPGYRIDPVGSGNGWTLEMDYVYADRGATVGFEFGHDGDMNGTAVNGQVTGASVSGDILSGTVNGNDPQITASGLSIDPTLYRFMEVRMRTGAGAERIDLFYANSNGGFAPSRRVILDQGDGLDSGWHTYLVDFNAELEWLTGGTVTSFRLDPASGPGGNGAFFEIEYIRFYEEALLIPEPGSAALAVMGMLMLAAMRKKEEALS